MRTIQRTTIGVGLFAILGAALLAGCVSGPGTVAPTGGVHGIVLVGPQCPVVHEGEACPDQPLSAPLEVRRVVGTELEGAQDGELIQRLRSDQEGEFSLALPPGSYWIIGLPLQDAPLPRPLDPVLVDVEESVWRQVEVHYDSGMR